MAFMPPLLKVNRLQFILQISDIISPRYDTHWETCSFLIFFPRWFLELNASNVGSFYHASFYARSRYHLESRGNLIMKFQNANETFSGTFLETFMGLFVGVDFHQTFFGTFFGTFFLIFSWKFFRDFFMGFFKTLSWSYQRLFLKLS